MTCNPRSEYYYFHGHCPPVGDPSTPWWHYALLGAAIVFVLILLSSIFKVIPQYERGIILRFGRVVGGVRQPGLRIKFPFIDTLEKVNVQIQSLPLEAQQVMSNDSVSLGIEAVVFYKVTDALKAIIDTEDYEETIKQYAQAIMRKTVGKHPLEDTLHSKEEIAEGMKKELDETVQDWGLEVSKIELKDINLPESIRRAMAAKPEAIREKEAKVISAEGERESAKTLAEAAKEFEDKPAALELRRLQVTREIATENSVIVVTPTGSNSSIVGDAAAGAAAGRAQQ